MKIKHNTEQMARGYLMYELAKRGYNVQLTDSRFPAYDLLVVSPNGVFFGIDVKGQRTASFWLLKERESKEDAYYAFVYVPIEKTPRVFIMPSGKVMQLYHELKERIKANKPDVRDQMWGLNWKQPHEYEDRYDLLPR
jgi:hypothetical protein